MFANGCILSPFVDERPYYILLEVVPAVHDYRAAGGWSFLSGSFHFLYQFQKRWSFVWSLLIRPRCVPVLLKTSLLLPTLAHTDTSTHRQVYRHEIQM